MKKKATKKTTGESKNAPVAQYTNQPDVKALQEENQRLRNESEQWRKWYGRACAKMRYFHARCDGHITREELGRAIADL
jgi:molecular chaperone GrpE (heat shock protein)